MKYQTQPFKNLATSSFFFKSKQNLKQLFEKNRKNLSSELFERKLGKIFKHHIPYSTTKQEV